MQAKWLKCALVGVLGTWALACDESQSKRQIPPPRTIAATVMAVLGDSEEEGAYFGLVSSVASDPDGRIYVADQISSEIQVFSPSGEHLKTIGREGQGPGEFQQPFDILFVGQELWVRDLNRIQQLLVRAGRSIPDSSGATRRMSNYANTESVRARMVGRDYYNPTSWYPVGGEPSYFYEVTGPDRSMDTIPVPRVSGLDSNLAGLVPEGSPFQRGG